MNHLEPAFQGSVGVFYLTQTCLFSPSPSKVGEFSKIYGEVKKLEVRNKNKREGSKVVTYTLCGSDVHIAADEGEAVVHAHLEINHPGI